MFRAGPETISTIRCDYGTDTLLSTIHDKFFDIRTDYVRDIRSSWKLLMTDNEIDMVVQWMAKKISSIFQDQKIVVVGIMDGAFIFMSDLCKYLTVPHTCCFINASNYKGQEPNKETIVHGIDRTKFEGRKIVLVDELFDRGKTLHTVAQELAAVLNIDLSNIFTCCLFAKNKVSDFPRPNLVGMNLLPDVWMVGYGLDDNKEKRGWPHLFACPKQDGIKKTPDDMMFMDTDRRVWDVTRLSIWYRLFIISLDN